MTKAQTKDILEKLQQMHPTAGCELHFTTPFELLVAVILSAQCTDKRVNIIVDKLFPVYNTPQAFANLTLEELKPYIFSCGFFNNKGNNIIEMSKILVKDYNSVVPDSLEELVKLPGVGRKTASVVLTVAFDKPAMPVDTHVFRVAKRIGLSSSTTVEGVEKDLKKSYEKKDWNSVHHTLIFQGRYICSARKPRCEDCLLVNICKEGRKNVQN